MFNIKKEDIIKFARSKTFEEGEALYDKGFFHPKNIAENDELTRYDTRIYSISWKDTERWWGYNTARIIVDINDVLVSYSSNCECRDEMCKHVVCLSLSINKKVEEMKKQMGPEKYEHYEAKLVAKYEKERQEYLEKVRLAKQQENLRVFNKILTNYEVINQMIPMSNKVDLEVIIKYDRQYLIALKIGTNRKYIVKSIRDFLIAVKNKRFVRYGKDLEFYHTMDNFNDVSKKLIELLLKGTSYWTYEIYDIDASNRERFITLSSALFEELINIYRNQYITYINNDETKTIYLTDEIYDTNLYLDEERIVLKDLKDYDILMAGKKSYIIINNKLYYIYISDVLKPLYEHIAQSKEIVIKDSIKPFLKEIYPLIYDAIEIEPEFKENNPLKKVKIDSYFDLEEECLNLISRYFIGDKETNIDILTKGSYSYSKLQKYQQYIQGLGFNEGKIFELEQQMHFMKSDLSFLHECGDVYLSDNIKNTQIKQMKKIVVNLSFNVDIFSVAFDELGYSDEDLFKIISEYKKKKKFVKLKNNVIVEMDDKNIRELVEVIDDFKMDAKQLNKKQERPLYVALKAFHKKNSDNIEFNYDDNLKEMITRIKNYKNSDYQLPTALNNVMRNYQVEGFKWLKTLTDYKFGGILADDMGLGKTLQIISLIISDDKQMPSLIICPTSLIYNWQNETQKWSKLNYEVVLGSGINRQEVISNISEGKNLYITSYDTFKRDIEFYKSKHFRFVILDEGQFIKNYNTQKAIAVKEVNSDVRFVLTGTPIENSLLDLWSIFDFLLPDYLSNHSNFKSRFEKAIISDDDKELLNVLVKKITPFILRRTKKSVLKDLPDKIETISYTEMEEDQRKVYEAFLLKTKMLLEEGKSKFEILSSLTRLRQLCVHPALFLDNYKGSSAKVNQFMDIVTQSISNDHRILAFSQFTSIFPVLENEFKKHNIKYFILQGSTKALERINLVEEFNANEEIKVFLISLKAGGTGLNLVGADIVVHFDPWWNVSVENQATDRAHRIGQKRSVQVIKMVCENTIEQKVIELQNLKKDLADKVLCDDDGNIQKLDEKDLHYILS